MAFPSQTERTPASENLPCQVKLIQCCAGYQLTSAECYDLRSNRVVVDQYCHYYPENVKPKPKLQECNMEPCLAR